MPSGSLEGGQPVLGALTGLFSGMSQGLKERREQDLAKQHLALQQQEQALRERAYSHGIQNETNLRDWAQRFGQFKAWEAGGAGAAPMQGPATLGGEIQAPSGIGPPEQAPASAPLGMGAPDEQARMAKIMDLARTAPNMETAHAFLGAVHEDEQKRAVQVHAQRIASELNDQIVQGAGMARGPDGSMDPTGNEALKQLRDQAQGALQSIDERDPKETAALLDHIEQSKQALIAQTAEHNTQQHLRELQGKRMLQQIQDKWSSGTAMSDLADAVAYYNTYTGAVDANPKDLGAVEKEFNEAISGVGLVKRQLSAAQAEAAQMRAQANFYWRQWQAEHADTPAAKAQRQTDLENQRQQGRVELKGQEGSNRLQISADTAQRVAGEQASRRRINAGVLAQQDPGWKGAKSEADQKAIVDKYDRLLDTGVVPTPGANNAAAGQPVLRLPAKDSASSILEDFRGGKADKATAIKRATALGYKSFDELQAAAGKK